MSYPTAVIKCFKCKREGIIEVFGPTKEIELPSGWFFVVKSHGYWRTVTYPLITGAFEYIQDLHVFCSSPCATAFVNEETTK